MILGNTYTNTTDEYQDVVVVFTPSNDVRVISVAPHGTYELTPGSYFGDDQSQVEDLTHPVEEILTDEEAKELETPVDSTPVAPEYKCDICGAEFASKRALSMHMRSHDPEKTEETKKEGDSNE